MLALCKADRSPNVTPNNAMVPKTTSPMAVQPLQDESNLLSKHTQYKGAFSLTFLCGSRYDSSNLREREQERVYSVECQAQSAFTSEPAIASLAEKVAPFLELHPAAEAAAVWLPAAPTLALSPGRVVLGERPPSPGLRSLHPAAEAAGVWLPAAPTLALSPGRVVLLGELPPAPVLHLATAARGVLPLGRVVLGEPPLIVFVEKAEDGENDSR